MTNTFARLLLGAAPAAGLALVLMQTPAHAQFFDIFNPPPQYSAPEPRYYSPPEQMRRYEPRRSTMHRRHHRKAERHHHRRRKVVRNDTWNPKEVKGPFQIVIAIAPQEALLYGQNGLIATARISTGMPGHPTPMGVFTVISKSRWHRSNIYSGAPMPWMQRITWSGVAMHEGPRPGYPASHGCIRLPGDFAVRLFHTTKVGARVIVAREPVKPVSIASPKLFVPKPLQAQAAAMSLAARSSGAARPAADPPADPPSASAAAATADAEAMHAAATDASGTIPLPPADPVGEAPKPHGPVSVFVSRKQMKVFVRQGFDELFDMPVTIADPDQPIGTHVYTAMGLTDDGKAMRWVAMSIPSTYRHHRRHAERRHHRGKEEKAEAPTPAASTATEALDRITLPPEAIAQIDALLKPGSSLIVSDNALSDETDDSTGFIVLTR